MDMALWYEIRRLYWVKGLYKKEIARQLGLSVKTVRRVLKKENPPAPITRSRKSKLDSFKEKIALLLKDYPSLSGVRIYEELTKFGYTGGKTLLRDYLLKVRPARKEAFVKIETPPGEEAQVDWGLFGDTFGCGRILSCFAFVLSHSRMSTFIWTLSQSLDDFLRAHGKAFHFFGGVPQRILYDNLKSVVLKRLGSQIQFHPRFMALAGHYLFEPRACNVRRGNEKGKVERVIGYVRENFFAGRTFKDLWDLRNQSDHWRDQVCNVRVHGTLKQRPIHRFEEEEKGALRHLPPNVFDTDTCISVKASPDCRVTFDTNTYSVPSIYAHLGLTLKANDSHLFLFKQNRRIATHLRCWQKYKDIEDAKHVEKLLEEKRRATEVKQRDSFLSLGEGCEAYLKGLIQTPRSLACELKKIHALITVYGKTEVLQAIDQALPFKAFGADYLKNIILQNLTRRGEIHPVGPVDSKSRPDLMSLKVEERPLEKYSPLMEEKKDEEPHE